MHFGRLPKSTNLQNVQYYQPEWYQDFNEPNPTESERKSIKSLEYRILGLICLMSK